MSKSKRVKALVHVDVEEVTVLDQFRKLRRRGSGRIEIVVTKGKLEAVYDLRAVRRRDVAIDVANNES